MSSSGGALQSDRQDTSSYVHATSSMDEFNVFSQSTSYVTNSSYGSAHDYYLNTVFEKQDFSDILPAKTITPISGDGGINPHETSISIPSASNSGLKFLSPQDAIFVKGSDAASISNANDKHAALTAGLADSKKEDTSSPLPAQTDHTTMLAVKLEAEDDGDGDGDGDGDPAGGVDGSDTPETIVVNGSSVNTADINGVLYLMDSSGNGLATYQTASGAWAAIKLSEVDQDVQQDTQDVLG
ncbi:hypothetical protein [Acidomonas methanolica]|uniref:hypothetical protein n=1 Tax=Acidomonas methanolica TaxID=437 RepID=UPI001C0544A6|nr:hypothetical protein [Acidomonas methanolica]MBU2653482.1 hypothetical protein [Acidomonas methanolica]